MSTAELYDCPPIALVVDDSPTIRAIIRKILTSLGWEVAQAEHGADALQVLDGLPQVSLILIDWNMPVMDGIGLVRAVRDDHRWDDAKIMMVTTESEPDRMIAALEAGADEYVMKPFTREALSGKLELLGFDPSEGAEREA
jgi:two-component system, chemotaxis family, chemotaxis protein CheY